MQYRIQNKIYSTLKEAVRASNDIEWSNKQKGILRANHDDATIHEYIAPLSTEQEYNNK